MPFDRTGHLVGALPESNKHVVFVGDALRTIGEWVDSHALFQSSVLE
jgi:hypothetical protein